MNNLTRFKFRLYVVGHAPNSTLAIANLSAFCQEYLPERHEIEVVDVLREPERALADSIMLTPALVRLSPGPVLTIIGSLGHREPLRLALGLPAA